MNKMKASLWIEKFKNPTEDTFSFLKNIYGDDIADINKKINNYITVLESFVKKYGDEEVIIARAPGRINLMGRHIEHRGGNINTIAIHKETLMVASVRDDDTVFISNTNSRFSDFEFSISEEMARFKSDEWIDYIDSAEVKDIVAKNRGHWVNYVKGSLLRICFDVKKELRGMNVMCFGTVPVAGGVSSSSSIVVATAELACAINDIDYKTEEFINLCGQGEWYVGSRGGAGDHAAIKCGLSNAVCPIDFEPIHVLDPIKIPDHFSVIVANSFIEAKKSEGAKDKFNQMVASYEFGVMLFKKEFPEYSEKIVHLRDINPSNLGVNEAKLYDMLKAIPLFIKPAELFELIPAEYHSKVKRIVSSHQAPDAYNLRSALIYGIAECERSRITSKLLAEGKIEEFANLMNISHNGDRVAVLKNGKIEKYDYPVTDEDLDKLMKESENGNEDAALYKQPGGYGCSVEQMDVLIDKLLCLDGVLGAQISGAGLGGCIMIFCEKKNAQDILKYLDKEYYKPNGFENGAMIVKPIKGAMCL